jgi:uracil-DNA glycosylase family 4
MNNGKHIGIHRIHPLPPEKMGLVGWYLKQKMAYTIPLPSSLPTNQTQTTPQTISQNTPQPPQHLISSSPSPDSLPLTSSSTLQSQPSLSPYGISSLESSYLPSKFLPPSRIPHILAIGMAPGESEDLHGEAFIGISGNILNTVLAYTFSTFVITLTNTVCCRPYHNVETTPLENLWGRNRDPEPSEMELCKDHTLQILKTYSFDGIITLGEVATNYNRTLKHSLSTLSLVHPAYIARLGFKLHTIRTEAIKIKKWLKTLPVHTPTK